jgi:hypothetical protein
MAASCCFLMFILVLAKGSMKLSMKLCNESIDLVETLTNDGMPISKNDFDKGRSEEPIISKILNFLESNKENAYTEEEIMGQLYPDHITWPGDTFAFGSAMLNLAYAGKDRIKIYQH